MWAMGDRVEKAPVPVRALSADPGPQLRAQPGPAGHHGGNPGSRASSAFHPVTLASTGPTSLSSQDASFTCLQGPEDPTQGTLGQSWAPLWVPGRPFPGEWGSGLQRPNLRAGLSREAKCTAHPSPPRAEKLGCRRRPDTNSQAGRSNLLPPKGRNLSKGHRRDRLP